MSTTTLNGRNKNNTAVLEAELIKDGETLEAVTAAPEAPETEVQQPEAEEKAKLRSSKKRLPLILAGLGVGAIAAGTFGYNYWQYTSTHEETDNATIAGHVHQISSKVPGTVAQILVNDNQEVQPGQLLVKLDPRDYESKVQQAAAALENARSQAQAQEGVTSAQAKLAASKGNLQQATASNQDFVSRGVDLSTAQNQAIASISNIVRREAFVMAFNDCFYFIGLALLFSGIAILFIKKVKATGSAVAH